MIHNLTGYILAPGQDAMMFAALAWVRDRKEPAISIAMVARQPPSFDWFTFDAILDNAGVLRKA